MYNTYETSEKKTERRTQYLHMYERELLCAFFFVAISSPLPSQIYTYKLAIIIPFLRTNKCINSLITRIYTN